jgi:hypothetical protein
LCATGFGAGASAQFTILFGSFSIAIEGNIAIIVKIVLIAVVAGATSRHTVNSTLNTIE